MVTTRRNINSVVKAATMGKHRKTGGALKALAKGRRPSSLMGF
jgi:hypothetical protein